MGVLNALRKGVAAAATAAVPMLQDNYRAQILAERDARLRTYDVEDQAANRAFQQGERVAGQEFTRGENEADREFRGRQAASDRTFQAGENDENRALQREGIELDRQRLDITVKQAEQALKAGEFDIEAKQQIQDLRDVAIDQSAPEEERTRAIENLEVLLGQSGNNYDAITMYDDEEDSSGSQRRTSGVLNRRTGQIAPTAPPSMSGAPAAPQTQEEFDALPPGTLYRDPEDGRLYQKP